MARCLEPHDAAVSKLMAGRDKDFNFISTLLASHLISLETLIERAALIQKTPSARALLPRLRKLLDHLRGHHTVNDVTPLLELIHRLASPLA